MKLCPTCKTEYNDDVEICPKDSTKLEPVEDKTPPEQTPEAILEGIDKPSTSAIDETTPKVETEKLTEVSETATEAPEPEVPTSVEELAPQVETEKPTEVSETATEALEPEDTAPVKPTATTNSLFDAFKANTNSKTESPDLSLPENETAAPDAATSDLNVEAVKEAIATSPTPIISEKTEVKSTPIEEKKEKKKSKGKPILIVLTTLIILGAIGVGIYWIAKPKNLVAITLNSTPPGANVILDGKNIGVSPITIKITKGNHQVVFEMKDHESVTESIEVIDNNLIHAKNLVPIQK